MDPVPFLDLGDQLCLDVVAELAGADPPLHASMVWRQIALVLDRSISAPIKTRVGRKIRWI